MTAPIIEIDKLTKSYGGRRGIVDVSLQIREGEVFGFLGPNGAGKTTTIRILMALLRADRGAGRGSSASTNPRAGSIRSTSRSSTGWCARLGMTGGPSFFRRTC